MTDEERKATRNRIEFWVCLITSIGLFVGGFFVPPMGVIDGSVLTAVGMLLGFAVLAQLPHIIGMSKSVKLTHGDTTIEVTRKLKDGEQPQEEK